MSVSTKIDSKKKSASEAFVNSFGGYPIGYGVGIVVLPLSLGWIQEDPLVANLVEGAGLVVDRGIGQRVTRRVADAPVGQVEELLDVQARPRVHQLSLLHQHHELEKLVAGRGAVGARDALLPLSPRACRPQSRTPARPNRTQPPISKPIPGCSVRRNSTP